MFPWEPPSTHSARRREYCLGETWGKLGYSEGWFHMTTLSLAQSKASYLLAAKARWLREHSQGTASMLGWQLGTLPFLPPLGSDMFPCHSPKAGLALPLSPTHIRPIKSAMGLYWLVTRSFLCLLCLLLYHILHKVQLPFSENVQPFSIISLGKSFRRPEDMHQRFFVWLSYRIISSLTEMKLGLREWCRI
jgi:hypothetical protein